MVRVPTDLNTHHAQPSRSNKCSGMKLMVLVHRPIQRPPPPIRSPFEQHPACLLIQPSRRADPTHLEMRLGRDSSVTKRLLPFSSLVASSSVSPFSLTFTHGESRRNRRGTVSPAIVFQRYQLIPVRSRTAEGGNLGQENDRDFVQQNTKRKR